MKAAVIPQFGQPLEWRDVPEPQAKPGELLVRVEAAGVNFADILTASGGYHGVPRPPLVAGREFAGLNEASGERLMGYTQWGAFAERVAAPIQLLWPVPKQWSSIEAAAFPVNYFTAYLAYWKAGLLDKPAGKRVLIHAAAGGVGTAAVEIGKILDVEIYGTSSSDPKLAKLKAMGLDHPINYKNQDYEDAIRELTHGEGVDAVFEMLGGEHVEKSVRCLRDFGVVITYGSATQQKPYFDPRLLYAKGTSVHGLWLTQLAKKPEVMTPAWQRLSGWANAGKLHPIVGHTLPMSRASEAFQLLLERKNFGKVVLTVS